MEEQEYGRAPLTEGHVGFEEPQVFPVRANDMPNEWSYGLVEPVQRHENTQIPPKYYPAGHEPYKPLKPEVVDMGLRGLELARAASRFTRERNDRAGQ